MKKNDVFTFTAPNGVEVTAVVVGTTSVQEDYFGRQFLNHVCYAQNRLFTYNEWIDIEQKLYGEVLVDYAVLPDYDTLLENYNRVQDTMRRADEERKSLEEWEENLKTFEYEDDLTSK